MSTGGRSEQPFDRWLVGGAGLALALLVMNIALTFRNTHDLHDDAAIVNHSHQVMFALEEVLSLAKDAETGQRGFLITGEPKYLKPYSSAIDSIHGKVDELQQLTAGDSALQSLFPDLRTRIAQKLAELAKTIDLRRKEGFDAARKVVLTDRGKAEMDALRDIVGKMSRHEQDLLQERTAKSQRTFRLAVLTGLLSGLAAILGLAAFIALLRRHLMARRAATLIIAEQRERLRTTLASIGDAVITTDRNGVVTYLNAVAESLTRWTNDEARGRPLHDVFQIVNEQTRQPVENPALRALQEGVIIGLANHTVLIAKDRTELPLDDSAAPIRCEEGQIVGCVLVFRDVTHRRQAEQAIQQSEERFRRAIMETALPTLLYADDDEILMVNKAWTDITGYSREQIPTISDWTALAYGERHATVNQYIETLFEANTRVDNGEWVVKTASDEKRVWHFFTTPLGLETSGRRLLVSNAIDVTEQKRAEESLRASEERLRLALQAENMAWWDVNIATGEAVWSESHFLILGYKPTANHEATFEMWKRRIHPEDRQTVLDALEKARQEHALFSQEHRILRDGGEEVWLAPIGHFHYDSAGEAVRFVGVFFDITERKRIEQELRHLAAELSEADRRKDEFLATLAHELRNPLAPVRNAVEILRLKSENEPELRWGQEVIERQLGHLTRLIDDLLDISRITRNKLELRKETVRLADVIRGAVESSRPAIDECGHELTVTLPPEPIDLNGDMVRLTQVFMNLLNNAAKYTPARGRIWLTAERQANEAVVSVRDTGIGISPKKLPQLFEMFFQIETTLERSHGGLGIGLWLVRRLVELHGGSVEARSEGLNKGSEFIVRLPILVEQSQVQSSEGSRPMEKPAATGYRIVVVDDNHDSAESLAMLLRLSGNEVRTAHDGLEGVRVVEEVRPQVALLDIGMPKLNGYEACRRIREQPWGKDLVLIALTGWGQEEDRRRTEEAGFDAHTVKPVDHSTLMNLLAKLLAKRTADGPPT